MKLKIKTNFRYAHFGYQFAEYVAGQEVETNDAEFAHVAVAEGWAELCGVLPLTAANDGAPETAAHKAAPKTKPKKA